jgi:hypothetical protein
MHHHPANLILVLLAAFAVAGVAAAPALPGKLRWNTTLPNCDPSGSFLTWKFQVSNATVIAWSGWYCGATCMLDAVTGHSAWCRGGVRKPPLLTQDAGVLATLNEHLVELDPQSGGTRRTIDWANATNGTKGTPSGDLLHVEGTTLYTTTNGNVSTFPYFRPNVYFFTAVDLSGSGRVLWQTQVPVSGVAPTPTPTCMPMCSGGSYTFAVPGVVESGGVVWYSLSYQWTSDAEGRVQYTTYYSLNATTGAILYSDAYGLIDESQFSPAVMGVTHDLLIVQSNTRSAITAYGARQTKWTHGWDCSGTDQCPWTLHADYLTFNGHAWDAATGMVALFAPFQKSIMPFQNIDGMERDVLRPAYLVPTGDLGIAAVRPVDQFAVVWNTTLPLARRPTMFQCFVGAPTGLYLWGRFPEAIIALDAATGSVQWHAHNTTGIRSGSLNGGQLLPVPASDVVLVVYGSSVWALAL